MLDLLRMNHKVKMDVDLVVLYLSCCCPLYCSFFFLVLFRRMYALHKSMNVGDPTFTKDDMIKILYISERQRMIISLVFFGVELRLNPKF